MKRHILSGGLIALGIGSILGMALFGIALSTHDISDAYGVFAEKIFNFFVTALLISPLSHEGFSFAESLVISTVYVFLLGTFVGWLYSKKLPRAFRPGRRRILDLRILHEYGR